jgi:hypothetical protein
MTNKGRMISFRANEMDMKIIEKYKEVKGGTIRKVTDADVIRDGLEILGRMGKYNLTVPIEDMTFDKMSKDIPNTPVHIGVDTAIEGGDRTVLVEPKINSEHSEPGMMTQLDGVDEHYQVNF